MPRKVKIDGVTFVKPLRFCNEDCNNCGIHMNRQFSLLINALYVKFGEEVYQITQSICPNMTCCADCRIDDFCHDEDCEIADEAEALIAAWYPKPRKEKKGGDHA